MSVLDVPVRDQPTAEDGALRIKRILAQTFNDLESTLEQLRTIKRRHGSTSVRAALGDDFEEVVLLYGALKELIEEHKPGMQIDQFVEAA